MSGRTRIVRNIAIGLAALIVLLLVGTIVTVRTDWFRNFVKQKIITATEDGTGGRVDIGSFEFAWSRLRAVVTGFVIHGNEPAGGTLAHIPWIQLLYRVLERRAHSARWRLAKPKANCDALQ